MKIKLTIFFLCLVLLMDYSQYVFIRNDMEQEAITISYLISSQGGLSEELVSYLTQINYKFYYDEDNSYKIGDIVYFELKADIILCFFIKKEIVLKRSTILGVIN